MNANHPSCPVCGGIKTSGTTTFAADLGSGVVVVRRVRATVCSQCGEEWIDDAAARRLEQVVNEAKKQNREIEVTTFR